MLGRLLTLIPESQESTCSTALLFASRLWLPWDSQTP
jgi:hypothetical protein